MGSTRHSRSGFLLDDGMFPDSVGCTFSMESGMGSKPSNNFQSDRPESGGADKDMSREKSGLPDRDKARFASEQAKRESAPADPRAIGSAFTIDNEPNNVPDEEPRER
jgi:hypothetical protein